MRMKPQKIKNYYKEKSYIHYSNCHEDAQFVLSHVKNQPKRILSIASALDNALALLLTGAEEVVAIDSNPTQIHLCALKKLAIQRLEYEEFLILLGINAGDSLAVYQKIKGELEVETRRYFDDRAYLIADVKLVHCGRFEYYFSIFKNKILPLIHTEDRIEKFMTAQTQEEQSSFYQEVFCNRRFRCMFKLFFSEWVMKKLGRDKDYFKYNEAPLADTLKGKFEQGIYHNLNRENPYLQYVVCNEFRELPLYLHKENFQIIKERIERLHIQKTDFYAEIQRCEKTSEKYDFMYLSDIFEYMSEDTTRALSAGIYNALNENGQALFFNMMNDRRLSSSEAMPFKEKKLDQTHDRAFYYTACYLYTKEGK